MKIIIMHAASVTYDAPIFVTGEVYFPWSVNNIMILPCSPLALYNTVHQRNFRRLECACTGHLIYF